MSKSKLNDIIKLCVGGKQFKTTRATLIADQNSMLAKMFQEYDESTLIPAASKDENGAYFIDRDPKYFAVILNFLRTGELEVSETIDLDFLLIEANYYIIDGLSAKIETVKTSREIEQDRKLSQIIYEIQSVAGELQSNNVSNEVRRVAYEVVDMNQQLKKMSKDTQENLEKIERNTSSFIMS